MIVLHTAIYTLIFAIGLIMGVLTPPPLEAAWLGGILGLGILKHYKKREQKRLAEIIEIHRNEIEELFARRIK